MSIFLFLALFCLCNQGICISSLFSIFSPSLFQSLSWFMNSFLCLSRKCRTMQPVRPSCHPDRCAVVKGRRLHEVHGDGGEPVHLHAGEHQAILQRIYILPGSQPGRAQRGRRRQVLHPQRRPPDRHGPWLRRQVLVRVEFRVQLQACVINHRLLLSSFPLIHGNLYRLFFVGSGLPLVNKFLDNESRIVFL